MNAHQQLRVVKYAVHLARQHVRHQRQADQDSVLTDVAGIRLLVEGAWATSSVRTAIFTGQYERGELHALETTLRSDDRYLEIGGGIGVLAAKAASVTGPKSVTVVEANPALVPVIRRTLELNGFQDVEVIAAAVSAATATGDISFYVHQDFWTSSLEYVADGREIRVPLLGLHDLIRDRQITYLNLDVEGAEVELLREALPSSIRALCVELHPAAAGHEAITGVVRALLGQGFNLRLDAADGQVLVFVR
jgi:FkbM family methyltransferase